MLLFAIDSKLYANSNSPQNLVQETIDDAENWVRCNQLGSNAVKTLRVSFGKKVLHVVRDLGVLLLSVECPYFQVSSFIHVHASQLRPGSH